MKVVIDISKKRYSEIKERNIITCGETFAKDLVRRIRNGTPLPEHHGRLKDIDAFITKVKADRKHSAYLRSWTADDVLNALDSSYAPTIIEAERRANEVSD